VCVYPACVDHGEAISYLTVKPGLDVFSSDGDRVGAVERVLGDEQTGIFDGIVIDTRLGPGGLRFVDAPEVKECRERGVLLAVATSDVGNLPEPSANPAVLEHHGVEDVQSPAQGKLRRAWDRISGR
jgi:PRC-barrel domain